MSIRVRCPNCNETAELPDEARGKRGLCNRCGTPVQIPEQIRKVCVFCHADVTDTAHIKDTKKNYVCETCWRGRRSDRPKLQDTLAPEPEAEIPAAAPTSTLDPDFAIAAPGYRAEADMPAPAIVAAPAPAAGAPRQTLVEHAGDDDAELVTDWPYEHKPSRLRRPRPRRASPVATLLSFLAVAISLATAHWTWTQLRPAAPTARNWEEAHRAQILVLKGQAEILVEMGHLKEGLSRYEELEQLVKNKVIRDPALRDELLAAWHARDTAISKDQLERQLAQANAGVSASAPAPATTITLIEESTGPGAVAPKLTEIPPGPTTQRSAFDPN